MNAVLLVSHGSRSPQTQHEIQSLVRELSRHLSGAIIEYAFLDVQPPSIPEGIDKCVSRGATQIAVTLNFLNSGRHVNEDIPAIVASARQKYPDIKFSISKPIGQHERIPDLFIDLIHEEFRR